MVEKAINIIKSVAVKLIELLLILAVFGFLIDILFPGTANFGLIKGFETLMKGLTDFKGFIVFIIILMCYERTCKNS